MVDITITGENNFLNVGTAGDDVVTFANTIVGPTAGANVGNPTATDDGEDSAVLADATSVFTTSGSVTYNATTGWSLTDGTAAVDTFDNAFTEISFSDDVTLVGGTAFTGDIVRFDATSVAAPTPTGALSANVLTNTSVLDWDGAALTAALVNAGVTQYAITSFDGNAVSAGVTANSSDGKGQLTANVAAGTVAFTPLSSAVAGLNLGDVAQFTYTVELTGDDAAATVISVDVTYSVTADWSVAADTLDLSTSAAGVSATEGVTFTFTDADGNTTSVGNGTAGGDDAIQGSTFSDTLTVTTGNNTVKGAGGNDIIDASAVTILATDVQTLGGGAGDDQITGGAGNDKIAGGGGSDLVIGGGGDDVIQGLGGDDNLNSGGTAYVSGSTVGFGLSGGTGKDTIRGGDGDDVLNGDAGDDELRGGEGDDVVDGGAGNDAMYTSLGDDILTGGLGDDVFFLKAGTSTTTITDFGTGNDKLDVNAVGFSSIEDVNFYVVDNAGTLDTVIIIDAETTVTLENFTGLAVANFDFV
jgi:hypothetical protein